MAKNGKDTKNTRHVFRRMHIVRNGEECNIHKRCEVGLKVEEIGTNNVKENELNPILVYNMVRLDN